MRSVQAAAVAGIVAAVGWSVVLAHTHKAPGVDASDAEITEYYASLNDGLAGSSGIILLTLSTIGFLWFMGVIRDRIGANEPKLYGTVFMGGGIVFACILFVGLSVLVAPAVLANESNRAVDPDTAAMTRALASVLLSVIVPRMASVFILSFSTLSLRTGAMARWVVYASYVVGILMLLGVTFAAPPVYLFPAWVGFVSLLLLIRPPEIVKGPLSPAPDA